MESARWCLEPLFLFLGKLFPFGRRRATSVRFRGRCGALPGGRPAPGERSGNVSPGEDLRRRGVRDGHERAGLRPGRQRPLRAVRIDPRRDPGELREVPRGRRRRARCAICGSSCVRAIASRWRRPALWAFYLERFNEYEIDVSLPAGRPCGEAYPWNPAAKRVNEQSTRSLIPVARPFPSLNELAKQVDAERQLVSRSVGRGRDPRARWRAITSIATPARAEPASGAAGASET